MSGSRKTLLLVAGVVALAGAAVASVVRYVPPGQVGVVRARGSVRHVPPGFVLVNPLRERLDRIPSEEKEVRGIASVRTADGFVVRIPFVAEVTLAPRDFDRAVGDRGGLEALDSVSRGIEAGLEVWGSAYDATDFLRSDLSAAAASAVRAAGLPIGMRIRDLRLQAPDRDLYLFLAEDALSRGDARNRIALIEEALAHSPDDGTLLTARGMLHELSGDSARAEETYLRALASDPGSEDALARLFVLLHDEGQLFRLERLLLDGIAANLDSVRIRNWLALTYVPLRRYDEALDQLRRARKLAPRDEATLTNLGSVYQQAGRPDDAVRLYRQALEESPRNARLQLNLGLAELSRGDLPAARQALEEALAAGPATIRLHNLLAETYRRSGLKEEATAQLAASYALDPDQPGLRDVLTRLLGRPPD